MTYGRRQEAFSANSPGLQSRPNAYAPGPHPQDIRWRNFPPSDLRSCFYHQPSREGKYYGNDFKRCAGCGRHERAQRRIVRAAQSKRRRAHAGRSSCGRTGGRPLLRARRDRPLRQGRRGGKAVSAACRCLSGRAAEGDRRDQRRGCHPRLSAVPSSAQTV